MSLHPEKAALPPKIGTLDRLVTLPADVDILSIHPGMAWLPHMNVWVHEVRPVGA
ncbi:hypothetical protein G3578_16350 [Brevibacillus sp. SYP-B805]|uniref:hypothetical protein n=1 Tax=Brevibacillus sp. SYP-B805 TaxID=1578199 RepID=UPI0013EBAEC6|nr:hypothetical protein [Brevibacillus sp. SYP-B805]NGQ96737.1 hypothetical protein [Brevibacillus sp. SYP-B805]